MRTTPMIFDRGGGEGKCYIVLFTEVLHSPQKN